jgi:hypothetical protein
MVPSEIAGAMSLMEFNPAPYRFFQFALAFGRVLILAVAKKP